MAGKHFALLGEHLGHSLSVPIHRAILRRIGEADDYRLAEVPREAFLREVPRLMETLDGFNVTIPYKRDVLPLLDELDPAAARIGAVNTAVRQSGRWLGCNTDAAGFAAMLRMRGMPVRGLPCWVLGTGGASAAVAVALEDLGAARVQLVSRNPGPGAVGYDQFVREAAGLLVNATPAGMMGQASPCPLTPDQLEQVLPRLSGVADLIYNPPETPLLRAAARQGLPVCNGWTMLVAQAVAAEQLWQGRALPENLTEAIAQEVQYL